LASDGYECDDVVSIEFCEVAHDIVTVSEVVLVAVTV